MELSGIVIVQHTTVLQALALIPSLSLGVCVCYVHMCT